MSSSLRSGFNTQRLVSVSGDSLKTCGSDLLCFFICSLSLKCRIHCNSISRHCERISHCAVRSRRARLYLNGLVGLAGRSILALSGFGFHYCHCVDFVIGVRLNGKCNLCARSSSRRIRQSHCAVSDTSRLCDNVCLSLFALDLNLGEIKGIHSIIFLVAIFQLDNRSLALNVSCFCTHMDEEVTLSILGIGKRAVESFCGFVFLLNLVALGVFTFENHALNLFAIHSLSDSKSQIVTVLLLYKSLVKLFPL